MVAVPGLTTGLLTYSPGGLPLCPSVFVPVGLSPADCSYRLRTDRLHLSGSDSGPADLPEAHQLQAEVCVRLKPALAFLPPPSVRGQ